MDRRAPRTRRKFLALGAATGIGALAGCSSLLGSDAAPSKPRLADFRGSNSLVDDRTRPDAPAIADLPDLEGVLTVYVGGGGAGRYEQLVRLLERTYPSFEATVRVDSERALLESLRREADAGHVRADVLWTGTAGALGAAENAGLTAALPASVLDAVSARFAPTDAWVGVGGVVRALAYDPVLDEAVPDAITGVPGAERSLAWAPRAAGFRSFVTALRHRRGPGAAKSWLSRTLASGPRTVTDEFFAADAVARGDATLALANHADVLQARASRGTATVDLAFTENDAGALLDTSSAGVLRATENRPLATRFVRHLLSADAQEFLATRAFTYPSVPGVHPVSALPALDALSLPAIPLTVLADVDATDDLLRAVGVLP